MRFFPATPPSAPPSTTRPVHPGQADDAPLFTNAGALQMGRDLVGSSPEISADHAEQAERMANAQGNGAAADPVSTDPNSSDERRRALREESDTLLVAARKRSAAAEADADATRDQKQPAGPGVVSRALLGVVGLLAIFAGIVSGGVLIPTVELLFGGKIIEVWGDWATPACAALAVCFGLVTPLVGLASAGLRAKPWKIVLLGLIELSFFGLLTWGRVQVMAPALPDASAVELAMLDAGALGRSFMMFAVEGVLIAVMVGVAACLSWALERSDERAAHDARVALMQARLERAQAAVAALEAERAEDLARLTERDVAIARGPKVRDLVEALIWQGASEQTQANFDTQNGAPRAKAGELRAVG